jgi:hypothetical protein
MLGTWRRLRMGWAAEERVEQRLAVNGQPFAASDPLGGVVPLLPALVGGGRVTSQPVG